MKLGLGNYWDESNLPIALYLLAELHADVFSRLASPLEVYVFAAVDERSEHGMFDEICRRCNGKQLRSRRDGGSMELPDWFMTLHSSSRHLCTSKVRTTVRITKHITKHIRRQKEKTSPEVRSRDGHDFQGLSLENGVDAWTLVRKTCVIYAVACNYLVLV